MIKESELNRRNAKKLSELILNHPDLRVIAWIDTDGIYDDCCCVAGNLNEPCIETLVVGKDDMYHSKEDSPYDDCFNYYGCECDDWTDEELEEKAKAIPWEDVIAVRVGVQ